MLKDFAISAAVGGVTGYVLYRFVGLPGLLPEHHHADAVVFAALDKIIHHALHDLKARHPVAALLEIKRLHAARGVKAQHDINALGGDLGRLNARLGPGKGQDKKRHGCAAHEHKAFAPQQGFRGFQLPQHVKR